MSGQVAADLRAAAEVLERDGWMQGQYHGTQPVGRSCHCAVGALRVATGFDQPEEYDDDNAYWQPTGDLDSVTRMTEAVGFLGVSVAGMNVHDPEGWIVRWNDAPHRTVEHVTYFLRAAADRAEAEQ